MNYGIHLSAPDKILKIFEKEICNLFLLLSDWKIFWVSQFKVKNLGTMLFLWEELFFLI